MGLILAIIKSLHGAAKKGVIVFIGVCLGIPIILGLSWAIICGFVYLICLCFGIEFSFLIATGVWIILMMLKK